MTVASPWTAGATKSAGNIVCPTNGVAGMFFRVTTAGTCLLYTSPSPRDS